jgi:hypothetical protein
MILYYCGMKSVQPSLQQLKRRSAKKHTSREKWFAIKTLMQVLPTSCDNSGSSPQPQGNAILCNKF